MNLRRAVREYKAGRATMSQAARLAGVEHEEMHRILVREGILKTGVSAGSLQTESDFLVGQAKGKLRG